MTSQIVAIDKVASLGKYVGEGGAR